MTNTPLTWTESSPGTLISQTVVLGTDAQGTPRRAYARIVTYQTFSGPTGARAADCTPPGEVTYKVVLMSVRDGEPDREYDDDDDHERDLDRAKAVAGEYMTAAMGST